MGDAERNTNCPMCGAPVTNPARRCLACGELTVSGLPAHNEATAEPSSFSVLLRYGAVCYFAGVALCYWFIVGLCLFGPLPGLSNPKPAPLSDKVLYALIPGSMAAALSYGAVHFGLGYGRKRPSLGKTR